jgi:hypothetical protein
MRGAAVRRPRPRYRRDAAPIFSFRELAHRHRRTGAPANIPAQTLGMQRLVTAIGDAHMAWAVHCTRRALRWHTARFEGAVLARGGTLLWLLAVQLDWREDRFGDSFGTLRATAKYTRGISLNYRRGFRRRVRHTTRVLANRHRVLFAEWARLRYGYLLRDSAKTGSLKSTISSLCSIV